MVNWLHESLCPRFTATSAAGHRPRKEPGRGSRNVCHFHRHHQAVSQSPTRERPRLAQSHSRTAERQRSGLTGRSVRVVESQPRCHPRAALPEVGSHTRRQGQSCQHHAYQAGPWLDAKKKTIRASEQEEPHHPRAQAPPPRSGLPG